jgi:hypothetical protein
MTTIGVAAEASSQSRRRILEMSPERVGAGVSLDSRMGNDGAAGVGPHVWIGVVGWLRIMAVSRTNAAGRFRGVKSGSGTVEHSGPRWGHRTAERGYNQATEQASP